MDFVRFINSVLGIAGLVATIWFLVAREPKWAVFAIALVLVSILVSERLAWFRFKKEIDDKRIR